MPNDVALDFTLLKTFLVVAETRSVSSSAAILGLSQPTVTQHLQRLEMSLGLPLLNRDTRPFGLTLAAEYLIRGLTDPIEKIERVLAETRSFRDGRRATLSIAMPDSLSCVIGAEILAASGHLSNQLQLRAGVSPWIENTLRAGLCDIAIDCPPFIRASGAFSRMLFHDPYVIIAPRKVGETPLSQIVREMPQVAFGRSSKFGIATSAIANELGVREPARFNLDSTHSLLRFVQAGYGWAITSAICLMQAPSAVRDLVIYECPPDQKRTFFLLCGKSADTIASVFSDNVISVFRMCLEGRWMELSPDVATLLHQANKGNQENSV